MEWLTSNGEVYHRACTGWTTSVEGGTCEHCGNAIPAEIVRLGRDQVSEGARVARHRDVQRRARGLTQKLAEVQARTEATLRRAAPKADESPQDR